MTKCSTLIGSYLFALHEAIRVWKRNMDINRLGVGYSIVPKKFLVRIECFDRNHWPIVFCVWFDEIFSVVVWVSFEQIKIFGWNMNISHLCIFYREMSFVISIKIHVKISPLAAKFVLFTCKYQIKPLNFVWVILVRLSTKMKNF